MCDLLVWVEFWFGFLWFRFCCEIVGVLLLLLLLFNLCFGVVWVGSWWVLGHGWLTCVKRDMKLERRRVPRRYLLVGLLFDTFRSVSVWLMVFCLTLPASSSSLVHCFVIDMRAGFCRFWLMGFSLFGVVFWVCDAETKRIEGHGEYGKRFRMSESGRDRQKSQRNKALSLGIFLGILLEVIMVCKLRFVLLIVIIELVAWRKGVELSLSHSLFVYKKIPIYNQKWFYWWFYLHNMSSLLLLLL